MAYVAAAKLTITQKFRNMNDADQLAEQMAAYEILAKCGGEMKGQWWLVTDSCIFSIGEYPDEASALLAQEAIDLRGAFELESQRALPLDEAMKLQADAKAIAGV